MGDINVKFHPSSDIAVSFDENVDIPVRFNPSSDIAINFPSDISPFGPESISGLAAWFDGMDSDSVALSGSKVTQWNDKSGNLRHASQAVDAERPTYNAGTGKLSFSTGDSTSLQTGAFVLNQPSNFYIVGNFNASPSGNNEALIDCISGSCYFFMRTTSALRLFAGANLTDAAPGTTFQIYHLKYNGASSEILIDGVSKASGDAGSNDFDGLTIGARGAGIYYLDGDIGEIIGYDNIISSADDIALRAYLTDRWGL